MQIYTMTTSVRLPNTLYDDLKAASKLAKKHPAQLIREGIVTVVKTYRETALQVQQ